jgi:hypothetical protein
MLKVLVLKRDVLNVGHYTFFPLKCQQLFLVLVRLRGEADRDTASVEEHFILLFFHFIYLLFIYFFGT